MIRVAAVIAVGQERPDFSKVVFSDQLIAHRTEGLPSGRPPVNHYESHVSLQMYASSLRSLLKLENCRVTLAAAVVRRGSAAKCDWQLD